MHEDIAQPVVSIKTGKWVEISHLPAIALSTRPKLSGVSGLSCLASQLGRWQASRSLTAPAAGHLESVVWSSMENAEYWLSGPFAHDSAKRLVKTFRLRQPVSRQCCNFEEVTVLHTLDIVS